jgi:hypothetical protein
MENMWQFDNNYFLNTIKKIDGIIATKKLTKEQIGLLEEDKLYLFSCLGEKPEEKQIDLDEALKRIEKKLINQINKMGMENIYYTYNIVQFIVRQSNGHETIFEEEVNNRREIFDKTLLFYENLDPLFYNIASQLVNSKHKLYHFSENPMVIDECVFMNYNRLPMVTIHDTKNMKLYVKLAHEMQHQIDNVINNHKYPNYSGFNHLLTECSAIFSELLCCDQISNENPSLVDCNSLFLYRINNIDSLSFDLMRYLNLIIKFENNNSKLDINTFYEFYESNFYMTTEEHMTSYLNHLLEYDIFNSMKYLYSYLIALDLRTIYKSNQKEALSLLKYIINFELNDYGFDSIKKKGVGIDKYQNGPYNHLKHIMEVDNKRLALIK